MATPADGNRRFLPNGSPRIVTAKTTDKSSSVQQVRDFADSVRDRPFQGAPAQQGRRAARERREARANKTRITGGFNPSLNPTLNISVGAGGGAAQSAAAAAAGAKGAPGGEFMSNEDIHAWSEHVRKEGRRRAVERALDAEHLESVLRHIPDSTGSSSGAWMRARRVSRHAKKIARAEQAIAKAAAQMYAQFQREYEAELRQVSAGRPVQQRARFQF
jgi:hypothetical protein